MVPQTKSDLVNETLQAYGILLLSDPHLPSLVSLVVGQPVRGSWWGHAMGQVIYKLASQLGDDPNVIATKLISGKVTFVHKKLWSQVVRVGCAIEKWQTNGLSESGAALLEIVREHGNASTNSLAKTAAMPKPGKACDELEKRLLVYAEEIHTESGAHAKLIQTWNYWCNSRRFQPVQLDLQDAKQELTQLIDTLNSKFNGAGTLPWQ